MFVKKFLKFAATALIVAFFLCSCATLDKFLDGYGYWNPQAMPEPQSARRVPLPPMIGDFEPNPGQ
ncbi:MAG TPA: hypothetical protein VK463_20100 [Desulfomonilaceae bacterium]|nr:hypothetical protein [Desulfomonilaceae bacterium]